MGSEPKYLNIRFFAHPAGSFRGNSKTGKLTKIMVERWLGVGLT